MARSDRHLRRIIFLVGAALTVIVLSAYSLDWLEGVESGLYDLRARECQHWTPRPSDKIVHVDIDDAVLEAVGSWPWPRTAMAEIIDEMSIAGATSIALDVLYSQPQKPEWVPEFTSDARAGSGKFLRVDHDANLAASFKRAGNVLLPASLRFVYTHRQTPGTSAAIALLSDNLELTPAALMAALKGKGIDGTDAADVEAIFFDLRREATRARIRQILTERESALQNTASSRPATLPATMPANELGSAGDAVALELLLRLFPHVDSKTTSPESKLVNEQYEQERAARVVEKLGRPTDPRATAFVSRTETLPVAELIKAAGATGFVDYPNIGDGTIRSVPLLMEFHGRWIPQFGLRVACQLLEVDPADLKVTPNAIIIPAGRLADGTPRPERSIPVRTFRRVGINGEATELPLVMDMPWFGGLQWWTMYDPARTAKAQHLSMSRLADVVKLRHAVEANSQRVDEAISFILDSGLRPGGYKTLGLAKESAVAYFRDRPAAADWTRRETMGKQAIELLNQSGFIEALAQIKPEDLSEQERGQAQELRLHTANLNAALAQFKLIAEQRAELKRWLGGKGTFVGWTAVWTAADRKATSLHSDAPGVIGHAVVANAILTGDFWRTLPGWVTVVVSITLGLLVTLAVAWLSPAKSLTAAMLLFAAYTLFNAYILFDYGNLILDLASPLLAILVPWAGGTTARLMIEAREKARITKRFATYVDPDLVNYVLETHDQTIFTGQRRQTAVVFTDLEGFTKLSEQLKEEVVPVLNDFMGRATKVIKKHGGLVNKFLGDGILFFFNAPKPNARFVADAIDAILDLQKMMVQFNVDLEAQGLLPVRLRAGLTVGEVTAGDAGTEDRADYTVIGDLVNLASRLESANKFFGTSSLVNEGAMQQGGDSFLFRPVGVIQVVGRVTGERVYEAMGWKEAATAEQITIAEQSTKVFDALTAGDAVGCMKAVEQLEAITGPTKLTHMYRAHCEPYVNGEIVGEMPKAIVLGEK